MDEIVKVRVKSSSYDEYGYRLRKYIRPFFRDKFIGDISQEEMQRFILTLKNEKTKKTLSAGTIHGIVSVISEFYDYCVMKKIVYTNPCSQIVLPKKRQKKVKVFSNRERRMILEQLQDETHSKSYLVIVALYTGMRLGELCSLKWECLDMENKVISIKTSKRRLKSDSFRVHQKEEFMNFKGKKTKEVVTLPKTDDSEREIPITSYLFPIFKELKLSKSEYVFPKTNGKHYDNRSIQKYFGRFVSGLGIKGKSFHTLRHTFATMAIESKMDIKTLSVILGHSNVNTTLNLYVHPNENYIRESMETLSLFISN